MEIEGVEDVACGEGVGIVLEDIALMEVFDGVAEVDGIGGVGPEVLLEFDDNRLIA